MGNIFITILLIQEKIQKEQKIREMSYTNLDYADNVSYSGSEHSYIEMVPSCNKANPSLPGRAPKRPDSDLTPAELDRRNKRRARNREAAERQRQRRQHKVLQLEEEGKDLKTEKDALKEKNKKLQEEIERVKFQLKVLEGSQRAQMQYQQPICTTAPITPTLISNHSGQMFLTDMAGPVTPVFTVGTPVFAAATQALNSNQFQFPPTTTANGKVERHSSTGSNGLETLMTNL